MRGLHRLVLFALSLIFLASCDFFASSTRPADTGLRLREVGFSNLPNWNSDAHLWALRSFNNSCAAIQRRNRGDWFGPSAEFGRVGKWQAACAAAARVRDSDAAAKTFFENTFQPHAVVGEGTFTGYYEVQVRGSRTRSAQFAHPVYAKPSDLNARSPYYSRAQIDGGVLSGRGLELMYLESAADAFLLHVQGSGAIALTDGSQTRLSYAGNNGHRFKSILSALEAAGYNRQVEGASMVDFRRWLRANPDKATRVIQANPRFIFFEENSKASAIGAQGVALTSGRSLAVDDTHLAYGIPIYLDTYYRDPTKNHARQNLERLVIAQDTGAAINGTVRGDFFWGTGEAALQYAGRMKEDGRYYLLLPK